jgi:hypothetical protein
LIRRILPLGVVLFLLVPLAATASAQASGTPVISIHNQYIINEFGYVILNETVTYSNNGTSSIQIPTVQLGIPDTLASHSHGFVLESKGQYSQTSSDSGNVTTFTITPGSPTLAAGSSSSVSIDGYLSGVLNITAGVAGNMSTTILLSPSFNLKVNALNTDIQVPAGGTINPTTGLFAVPGTISEVYANTTTNIVPTIHTAVVNFTDTTATSWMPVQVYSVIRTIVPTSNGVPQVEDIVSLRNLASTVLSSLPLTLLASDISNVTIIPSSTPPTINPTPVVLTSGALNIAAPPFSGQIQAGDNFTFAMVYNVPKSDISTSGNTVSVSIPYLLPIQAVVQNYTVTMSLPNGVQADGSTRTSVTNATPLNQGTIDLQYTVSPGWASGQAVPVAALLFGAVFLVLAFTRSQTVSEEEEEEEDEALSEMLAELIKTLEEKISIFQGFQDQVKDKSQGTVSRSDFNKIKNELDSLKVRATGRLNAVRQATTSQRYLDLLNQLQEAEREEDRAVKDLLNLYDQYQSKRMREETFKRLLSNYRKRVDSATNHLSDLLNLAQREGKQA